MNYRHIYHAGHFADVFKHIVLMSLINHLKNKPTEFCYLDTHAGIGCYSLNSDAATKTQEFTTGISKIYDDATGPELVQEYLTLVRNLNQQQTSLQLYPGSPLIAANLLREQDRLVLCELHQEDYKTLKKLFQNNKKVAVHQQNGYLGMKAFLPPKEKRGLVLIDPPYETGNDFKQIIDSLKLSLKSWPNGTYAIWYPIKASLNIAPFMRQISAILTRQTLLNLELNIYPKDSPKTINGSGMLIINPPWQLEESLKPSIRWLQEKLMP